MATRTAAVGELGKPVALSRRVKRAWAVIAAACLIAVLAVVAFLAGEHQQRPLTILSGLATVGNQQATVTVAGWSYAIDGTGIMWVDQQGSLHDGGWPACLSGIGRTVPIRFGEVPVTAPDGTTWRQVVWVDCQP